MGGQPVGHALQAGTVAGGGSREAGAIVGDRELQDIADAGQADGRGRGAGVLGHVLQRLERAEVDGALGVLRVPADLVRLECDRHRAAGRPRVAP